jgi:hypothetical protein
VIARALHPDIFEQPGAQRAVAAGALRQPALTVPLKKDKVDGCEKMPPRWRL